MSDKASLNVERTSGKSQPVKSTKQSNTNDVKQQANSVNVFQNLEQKLTTRQYGIIALLVLLIALVAYVVQNLPTSCNTNRFNLNQVPSGKNLAEYREYIANSRKPVAWITGQNIQVGYLDHVINVFKRIGFDVWTSRSEPPKWDVLWSHEYPFVQSFNLPPLKPHQRVNHFPGSGFITNKVNLATSGLKHIPKAFNVPREKDAFLKYAVEHPEKLWVQKDNNHRGIRVKSIEQLSLDQKGTFVQEYIQNPLLIDGKKFDIGLYVTMTSINPLRVYVVDNEVLLRFCAKPYHPFNVTDLDSYVVGDVYTPIWDIPSLKPYYVDLNMNMKSSLNAYIRNNFDKDPATVWNQMEESIKTIYYMKEEQMIAVAGMYPSTRNFFEMVRFDFTLDDQLNVYLMEANMSPNLASAKYPPNKLIYEQVIYSVFSLVGIVRMPQLFTWHNKPPHEWNMMVQEKDLSILPEVCADQRCLSTNQTATSVACTEQEQCDICFHCLQPSFKTILMDAYVEEHSRWHNKRLIPSTSVESPITLGQNNYLQDKWFIGKCITDPQWCN